MRHLRIALQNPLSIVPMASAAGPASDGHQSRSWIQLCHSFLGCLRSRLSQLDRATASLSERKPGAVSERPGSLIDSNPLHNSVYHTAGTWVVRIESCP
jgi:hypothetical protein